MKRPDTRAIAYGSSGRTWWTTFGLAVLGLFAVAAPWAYNTPIGSYPDEYFHAYYARAVVTGQAMATSDKPPAPLEMHPITIPAILRFESVDGPISCYLNHPEIPAGCDFAPVSTDGDVPVEISLARYPPGVYALSGLPTLLEHFGVESGRAIWLLSRLTTALVCAVLLASAIATAGTVIGARRSFLIGLISLLPMGIYFASGINPQGLEIWAAVALAMFFLTARERQRANLNARGAAWGTVLAFGVLVNSRPLSIVFASIVVVALALTIVPPFADGVRLLRQNAGPAALAAGATVLSLAWLVGVYVPAVGANAEVSDAFRGFSLVERLGRAAARIDELFPEYVIVTGWLDTKPPAFVHIAWYAFVAIAAVCAWSVARRFRLPLAMLGVTSIVVPIWLFAMSGLRWQGRYTLPLIGPALVLMLWALSSHEFRSRNAVLADRLLRAGLVLTVVSLAVSMYWSVIRFSYGLQLDPLFPSLALPHGSPVWVPPNGFLAGALVAAGGLAMPFAVSRWLGRLDSSRSEQGGRTKRANGGEQAPGRSLGQTSRRPIGEDE